MKLEQDEKMRIEKESRDKAEKYEYEVKLRLQFESKLNSMHSMHRATEKMLHHVKNDKLAIQEEMEYFKQQTSILRKQYNQERIDKEEVDQKIDLLKEKNETLVHENSMLKENIKEYEDKLSWQRKNTIRIDGRSIHDVISELKEDNTPEIEEIEPRISDLDKYLPKSQVEVYEKRYNDLSEKYNTVMDELKQLKSMKIGNDEIINDHDKRIKTLREELNSVKGNYLFVNLASREKFRT